MKNKIQIMILCLLAEVKNITYTGLPEVRKCSGKNKILEGPGKVGKFHFESGKIDILSKKSQGKLSL